MVTFLRLIERVYFFLLTWYDCLLRISRCESSNIAENEVFTSNESFTVSENPRFSRCKICNANLHINGLKIAYLNERPLSKLWEL